MEMQQRWRRLIEALSLLLVLLRAYRQTPAVIGASDEDDTVEAACDACCERLEEVLLPTEETFKLERAIENARNYHLNGVPGAAAFEVDLALRRAARLCDAY